jgi:Flp pilus assembly protein TadB
MEQGGAKVKRMNESYEMCMDYLKEKADMEKESIRLHPKKCRHVFLHAMLRLAIAMSLLVFLFISFVIGLGLEACIIVITILIILIIYLSREKKQARIKS